MSQRRTTAPPTRAHTASARIGREELIAKEDEKQSAKRRSVLDNRFHRTFFRSAARGLHLLATLTPEPAKHEARKRRTSERPRVGCTVLLG
jgi:hypothetical protein